MNPLVSILIPAYNSEEWITDTIRSAIAQNWARKEIIIVDDGSKDSTLAIARKFESACVRVFTQQNQGAAAARNKAFSLSQGDYIQWLDADDLLDPDKINMQMAALDRGLSKRTLLSSGWAWFMYRHNRAKFVPTALWCNLSPAEWLLRKMDQNLHMQTATWLVSRELSEAAGQWNTSLLGDDDGEYFCRVLLESDGTRFVPESKVYYRMAGTTSLSYIGRSDKKLDAQWHSMKLHVGYLRSLEDSQRVRAACVRYLQNWSFFFYPQRMDLFKQAGLMANELGGQISSPRFSWKYSWIDKLFGTNVAKRAQLLLRNAKWSVLRRYDKVLSVAEGKKVADGSVLGES